MLVYNCYLLYYIISLNILQKTPPEQIAKTETFSTSKFITTNNKTWNLSNCNATTAQSFTMEEEANYSLTDLKNTLRKYNYNKN